jgi:hypothetical protein
VGRTRKNPLVNISGFFLVRLSDSVQPSRRNLRQQLAQKIRGAHSPSERVNVASVARFWDFLCELLAQIPARRLD